MRTRACLIPNSNCEINFFSKKQDHDKCKTKIQQDFIAMTKQEQNKDVIKKNIPKIGVEQTKGNEESYLYLYPLGT
jgi:hypothetical protein